MAELIKKVCICGDPNVGKTSLVKRFVTGKYDDKYISTLGTVITKKSVSPEKSEDSLTMMLWDVSGQKEFKRIHASAFKNARGAFAVCDLTRPETAGHLQDWISNFQQYAGKEAPVTVLVNKSDLTDKNKEEFSLLCGKMGTLDVPVYLTSAKTGENVEDAFTDMANHILNVKEDKEADNDPGPMSNGAMEFGSPAVFLDFVMMRFCDALGDHEFGMHIIRKQVNDNDIDFHKVTKKQIGVLIKDLSSILGNFKGEEIAIKLRAELMNASERCREN